MKRKLNHTGRSEKWGEAKVVKQGGPGRPEGPSVAGTERMGEEWHHMAKNYGRQL